MKNPRWVWLCGRVFSPFVRRWRIPARARAESRLHHLMNGLRQCETRDELERLLGKPKYALQGDLFLSGSFVPDRAETYEKDGCLIDLLFENDHLHSASGCVPYTAWDLTSGLAS